MGSSLTNCAIRATGMNLEPSHKCNHGHERYSSSATALTHALIHGTIGSNGGKSAASAAAALAGKGLLGGDPTCYLLVEDDSKHDNGNAYAI